MRFFIVSVFIFVFGQTNVFANDVVGLSGFWKSESDNKEFFFEFDQNKYRFYLDKSAEPIAELPYAIYKNIISIVDPDGDLRVCDLEKISDVGFKFSGPSCISEITIRADEGAGIVTNSSK